MLSTLRSGGLALAVGVVPLVAPSPAGPPPARLGVLVPGGRPGFDVSGELFDAAVS